MIALRGVHFSYGRGAFSLCVPELDVVRGACAAVIGPSGCGKTTLLNLIAGVSRPDAGTVAVGGEMVSAMADAARRRFRITRVGFVFQDFALVDYLNAEENILLPYLVNRALTLDDKTRGRLTTLAGELNIGDLLRRPVGKLSQGERQRVALCRALLPAPPLLLADEPTGNVDPRMKKVLVGRLLSEARARGATLLMVTHDHDLLTDFDQLIDLGKEGCHG